MLLRNQGMLSCQLQMYLEVRGRAQRCKSEWKVNLSSFNSYRSNLSWQMTHLQKLYPRTTWRMDLRQLTVYEHFGCVDRVCACYNFIVDQSSSRLM